MKKFILCGLFFCATFISLTAVYWQPAFSQKNYETSYEKQPNIILFITDEERALTPSEREQPEIKDFFAELHTKKLFAREGLTFLNHSIGSAACTPSRGIMFTGTSPALTGISQTRLEIDRHVTWLRPDEVPTIGHLFKEAGYESYYFGKWHLSDADQRNSDGSKNRNPAVYQANNPLAAYGFDGWIGPDPHGAHKEDMAITYDLVVFKQAMKFLKEKRISSSKKPWLLVVSFTNPHDINFSILPNCKKEITLAANLPEIKPFPSYNKSIEHETSLTSRYRENLKRMVSPSTWLFDHFLLMPQPELMKYYYSLIKKTDNYMWLIIHALENSRLGDDTLVIHTSDHGSQLSNHGLSSKLFNFFRETENVPFAIYSKNKDLLPTQARGQSIRSLTSHFDLAPTLLKLAKIDMSLLLPTLKTKFKKAGLLPGRDLSQYFEVENDDRTSLVYFRTEDKSINTDTYVPLLIETLLPRFTHTWFPPYPRMEGACAIEGIKFYDDNGELWKFTHIFDETGNSQDEEFEIYNMTKDPHELVNLAGEIKENNYIFFLGLIEALIEGYHRSWSAAAHPLEGRRYF